MQHLQQYHQHKDKQSKTRLKEKVLSICKNQKHYIEKMLNGLLEKSEENALIICDYIIAEQNEN